jgi:hypothetical protein
MAYSQDTSVTFSSAYTYLSKECNWAYPESDLAEGQDNALACKGFDKYRLFIYFSALDSFLTIQLKANPDKVILNPAVAGINEKKGVVEWRMANGIPFAIIVRSKEYSNTEEGRKVFKESLIVRGLEHFSGISGSVSVRNNKRANEEARNLADDGYNKRLYPTNR